METKVDRYKLLNKDLFYFSKIVSATSCIFDERLLGKDLKICQLW